MKYTKHFRNWATMKRWFRWIWLKILSTLNSNDHRPIKPKKLKDSERTAMSIFLKVLFDPGTKLYYDLHTQECYLKSEDSTLYIFLENLNVKIINSVYGYDVNISRELESYLLEKFRREMAVRRQKFKSEALAKIEHSLEGTLEKLTQKYSKQ